MYDHRQSKFYYPFLIIVTLILALIFYSGIIMKEDTTGRLVIGSLWLLLGIGWISKLLLTKKT